MIKKIITKNLPCSDCRGQYSFDGTLEDISIDGQQQLYSVFDRYLPNQINLENYRFIDSATFSIKKAVINRTGLNNKDSDSHDFKVLMYDDAYNSDLFTYIQYNSEEHTIEYADGAYEILETAFKGQLGRFYDPFPRETIFYCGKYWEPGDLANWVGSSWSLQDDWECQLYDWDDLSWYNWNEWLGDPDLYNWYKDIYGFPYNEDFENRPEDYALHTPDFIHLTFPYFDAQEHAYYIALYAKAHDNEWLDELLQKSYTVYRIDKNDLIRLWKHETMNTMTIKFHGSEYIDTFDIDGNITYPIPGYISGGGGDAPKYKGDELEVEITLNGTKDFTVRDNWAIPDIKDFHRLDMDNKLDYQFVWDYNEVRMTDDDVFDFRPISYISAREQWDFDLQQFYEYGDGYVATTAPNEINLTFRIAENSVQWFPEYLDGYNDEDGNITDVPIVLGESDLVIDSGINFMMYVYDWDGQDMDIDWDYISADYPQSYDDLLLKQRRDLYNFTKLYETENGINWTLGNIPHQYSTAGSKIIKAVIFSYVPLNYNFPGTLDDGGGFITPLRWKAINIKLNMGYDLSFVDDFSDIGGFDYTFLPWPETAAVVSGLSTDSAYVNAVREIVQENRFGEDEYRDYNFSHIAFENIPGRKIDEIGNYIGKVDLGQIRYFNKPYTMDELLMLPQDGNYIRYDDFDNWYSYDEVENIDNGMPQYPRNEEDIVNSCVGLLFIKDDINISRMESCIMELNFKEVNGITVRDTSGNDNRGLLFGDYIVDKPDFGIPLNREEAPEMPEIVSDKLSF